MYPLNVPFFTSLIRLVSRVERGALHRAHPLAQAARKQCGPGSYGVLAPYLPLFTNLVERLSEKGTSNAPIVDLAGLRRAKWTGKPLCGDLQGYAASASEAFRTVSEVVFSEVRNREQRPSNSKNHSFGGYDEAHNLAKMPWRENKATRMVEA
jgi:hypothetical protein